MNNTTTLPDFSSMFTREVEHYAENSTDEAVRNAALANLAERELIIEAAEWEEWDDDDERDSYIDWIEEDAA